MIRRDLFVRLLFALWLATPGWSVQAAALDKGPPSVSDFQRTTFTARDGAPERVWASAQTSDGWLWFGGSLGLTRFDGVEFEKVDVATADGRLSAGVSALYALPSGGLVIGHLSGGVTLYRHGRFTRFDSDEMHAVGRPLDFVANDDGVIWGSFENALMRFDGGRWTRIGASWNLPDGLPHELHVDAGGTLWVHTENSISRLAPGARRFEFVDKVVEPGSLIQEADGTFRFLGYTGAPPEQRWSAHGRDPGDFSRRSNSLYVDSRGYVWPIIGAIKSYDSAVAGLAKFGHITNVFEDVQGNVWMAEVGQLHRLRRAPVVRVVGAPTTVGEKSDFLWINLASDRGTIWFTQMLMSNAVLGPAKASLWTMTDATRPMIVGQVESAVQVSVDPEGGLWVAGASGLWELDGKKFVKRGASPAHASGSAAASPMSAGCAGGLWMAVRGESIRRFSEGAWEEASSQLGLPSARPTSLYCDRARNLWLGYGDGRVARVDQALKTTLFPFVGPGIGAVSSISVGRSTLIGGSSGLAILTGSGFTRLPSRLPVLEGITGIVESPDGYVWLNGARGLIRIWTSDLENEAARSSGIRTELLDADDGFPAPTYSLALWMTSIALDRENRVWFSGGGGLAFLDAAKLPPASPVPRIVVKSLIAGGRSFNTADAVSLPTGTRNIEVAYTALGTPHPDRIRFRYRLDGVDDDWVNVEGRRRAIYTNLPPGSHRFQVDASDESGSWANQPSILAFEIPPTFVQSWTFKFLCVAMALGLLVLAYRLRMRYHERRHRQLLIERLDERERIARELHDTLLQGTQALILKVHSATRLAGKDEPIHQVLDKALDQATGVMVEARNRIEDLRMQPSPDDDLATLLARFGEELVEGDAIVFNAYVEGSSRDLVPEVLREAGLIGREALLNAFHHARASTIELQITFADDNLQLHVRDDGLGFDEKMLVRAPGGRHWGLPGMQERANAISSKMSIWSRPGSGTEVELRVPAHVAYAEPEPRRRWSGWRRAFGSAA